LINGVSGIRALFDPNYESRTAEGDMAAAGFPADGANNGAGRAIP